MKFKLREWTSDDLDSLVQYANNSKIASNLTDGFPFPYTEQNGREFIERFTSARPANVMCIDVNGRASGAIGLHAQSDVMRKSMELGYWLAEDFWGNGIITACILQMVDYGFKTFEINRIYARPYATNPASKRVLEKAGFNYEGTLVKGAYKNDQFVDLHLYAVVRDV